MDEIWTRDTTFPDELNPGGGGFSVDVLCENDHGDHAVGWFDFNVMDWKFPANENFGRFKWRYLDQENDRWTKTKN